MSMFADTLANRLWLWDGEDRRVEVWLRHDGFFRVVRLHRVRERRWREVEGETEGSQAAAMALAHDWMIAEQRRMP